MAWNHDDVGPTRPRHELLDRVVVRGERLRRRQRVLAGLGGGVAVLLAVAGVAAVVGTGDQPATQVAAGGAPATTVVLGGSVTGGTTFALDAPSTSAAPQTTTVDAAPRATVTTAPPVAEPAPVTTIAGSTPQTTIPASGQPHCSPDQMAVTLTLAPTFRPGEPVVGQAVLRNTSGAACYYASYTQSQEIRDAGGNPVSPGSALIADNFADTPFPPDKTLMGDVNWDQQVCVGQPACAPAPPGDYTATVTWSFDGPPIAATATFRIAP